MKYIQVATKSMMFVCTLWILLSLKITIYHPNGFIEAFFQIVTEIFRFYLIYTYAIYKREDIRTWYKSY